MVHATSLFFYYKWEYYFGEERFAMYLTEATLVVVVGLAILTVWVLWKVLWNAFKFIYEFVVSMIRMILATGSLVKSILYALLMIGGVVCTVGIVGLAVVLLWWCLTDVFTMLMQTIQQLPF